MGKIIDTGEVQKAGGVFRKKILKRVVEIDFSKEIDFEKVKEAIKSHLALCTEKSPLGVNLRLASDLLFYVEKSFFEKLIKGFHHINGVGVHKDTDIAKECFLEKEISLPADGLYVQDYEEVK